MHSLNVVEADEHATAASCTSAPVGGHHHLGGPDHLDIYHARAMTFAYDTFADLQRTGPGA